MHRQADYDVLIAGGGLVGASLAAALAPLPLRIGVIEAVPFRSAAQPSYDDRATALSWGSRVILESIGLWAGIATEASPIRRVHVSERGRPGVTQLQASDHGVEALGYVVPNRVLGAALQTFLAATDSDMLCPATVERIEQDADGVDLEIAEAGATRRVRTRLLVAADGARSRLREQLGIRARVWDYEQHAVVLNVTPEIPQAGVAYERFTAEGPMALLPLGERSAVVLTLARDRVRDMLSLDDAAFLAHVQERFGGRLGALRQPGARQHYPLHLVRSREQQCGRVLIAGNAAHSLHPIAGQGFNLSLRDIAALADVLADLPEGMEDCGDPALLQRYLRARRHDQILTTGFTDMLHRVFGNPLLPVRVLRGMGLLGLSLCPPARASLARHAMGLAGRLPRLARGVALQQNR